MRCPSPGATSESDEENDGGFPLWAVIAIAVVGVAVIAAVTVLVLHKKK